MKTKALISFAVTAKLVCVFVFAYAKAGFLMMRLKYNVQHILLWKPSHANPFYIHSTSSIISLPVSSCSQDELIVYPGSECCHCCPPQCSNIFSSETAWPIKARFHVEPREGGTKVCINMTKMAPTPIYIYMVKTFKIFFFIPVTRSPMNLKLGMQHL